MLGNVWELCSDEHSAKYYETLPNPAVDPLGLLNPGKMRTYPVNPFTGSPA